MASNSIKQKRTGTFWISSEISTTNFDANILGNLRPPNLDRAAWVLVGGRSSRMGTDKARVESGGRALALRVADQAAAACATVSLVGDPAIYSELGLPVVADRFPGQGPLAGIEAALGTTNCDANLIVACDMPAIRENLLEELFAAAEDCDCSLPRQGDGRLEPLCAVYRKCCHPVIRAALEQGVRRVTDALQRMAQEGLAIRYVRVSDPTLFANLNTPEDWRRYHHG
jgi:molybdenum cofactor guanylyltransferase